MKSLSEADEAATRELLVGRRIVHAEQHEPRKLAGHFLTSYTGTLTLDDGTKVLVAPNEGGCSCGAGDYELTHLAAVDNVITDVRLDAETAVDKWGEGPTSYRIFVVADAVEINALQIDGDDGNGYYGTGYQLFVQPVDLGSGA